MKSLIALIPAVCLVACSSSPTNRGTAHGDAAMPQRVGAAVVAPLHDLNLVKSEIPAVLDAARKSPYAAPLEPVCESLLAQLQDLDAALGPDLDAPDVDGSATLLERGLDQVGNSSVSAIHDTTTGILPFRGWLRKLTGAERHSSRVTAAVNAGLARRAYLKGFATARACALPSSAVTTADAKGRAAVANPAAVPAQPAVTAD